MRIRDGLAVATTVALAVSLTACAPAGTPTPDTLTVLTNIQPGTPAGDVQQRVVERVERETGKHVKLIPAGETIPDVYETSVAGGRQADVVVVNLAEKSTTWVRRGVAEPAGDYIAHWGLSSRIEPEAEKEWTEGGVLQGIPYSGFVWPVWYNTSLLAKAGVHRIPKTVDDLVAAAPKLRAAGVPGMIVGGNDWSGQKLFLQIVESTMSASEATQVMGHGGYCASAQAMNGIDLFTRLRDAGVFVDDVQGYTADQMNQAYYDGKAAMMSAGSWAFQNTPKSIQRVTTLGGFPVATGGSTTPTVFRGYTGSGFFISANGARSDKIALTKAFVTAWFSPSIAAAYATATDAPTAVVAPAGSSSVQSKNLVTKQAVDDVPLRTADAVMPDTVVPGSVSDPMIRATSLAYSHGQSATSICSALDRLYR